MFKEFNTNLEEIENNVKTLIEKNYKTIEMLLEQEASYEGFVKAYEKMEDALELEFTQISHLNSVNNSEESQERYAALLPIITEYSTKLSQDERLYDVYKKIKANYHDKLTQEQQKVLDDSILGFKLSGSDLDEDKKNRLAEISLRLSDLSNNFSQNLLDATNAYELIITDEKDVEGIPESDKAAAKCEEGWKFTLQMPSYIAYMTYGPNEKLRERLYREYVTRAPQNAEIIDEILALKNEKAKILGFESYAALSLATKMANRVDEVIAFLEELAKKSKKQGEKEFQELEAFAGRKLNSWDMSYYAEKLRKERYDLDEEEYRPYFEKSSVVDGLFRFLDDVFGMRFEKVDIELWDEKAVAYDIKEEGEVIARIYLDLEARASKRGGAWMHNWQSHHVDISGDEIKASAFVVCNFPPSSDNHPSLLRHSDVVTLFHEMGHAIHHLMSKTSESFVSGVNGVEWDAVEFPSQFLEEFAYEKDVLQTFALHLESKEVIPDAMIARLKEAKNFQSAMAMLRQVEFALFDFKLHSDLYQGDAVQKLLDEVREEVSVHIPPAFNKFQNGFAHIFAGGYAAGYYSYKWAEVLSSDAFIELIESGFDERLTRSYKEHILYKGGSDSMKNLFHAFLGREPKVDNLLKISGIV
jgi:oligopeptidase A